MASACVCVQIHLHSAYRVIKLALSTEGKLFQKSCWFLMWQDYQKGRKEKFFLGSSLFMGAQEAQQQDIFPNASRKLH